MGQVISHHEQIKQLPGYDTDATGLSPLVVTQQSANSGGLWGVMDGAMIEFLGDTAIMFGGWAGDPTNTDWTGGVVTNLVYRSLDFGQTWAKIRDHDLTPDSTHYLPCHAAAHCKHTVGGTEYIYLIGGDNNSVNSEVRRTVDGITWTLVAADGVAGWDGLVLGAAGSLGGNLYLAGGHDAPGGTGDLEPATVKNEVWRSTDHGATWVSLGNAPWAGRQCQDQLVLHDGKLWVLGGGVYSNTEGLRVYYNDVWCFDGTSWTQVLANGVAPWAARFYANARSWGGWLYISRGYNSTGNLADTWRSRDGVTWYEVDLGAGFIASHADAMGVHETGILVGPGNGRFLNEVNSNSPSYFVSAPVAPIASGVSRIVAEYVATHSRPYNGVITEGYTEGTNPRVITPGTNDKLLLLNMPHRDPAQHPAALIAGYSYNGVNTVYIGGGASNSEVSATEIELRLGTTATTPGGSSKIAAKFNASRAAIEYESLIIGCNELAGFGSLTADTDKLGVIRCPARPGSSLLDTPMTLIAGYSWTSNNTIFIGGGINGSYAATSVEIYVAANATTAVGTKVLSIDVATSANDSGLLLLLDGSMKRVVAGAADSGGTGFRALRVAN